ncbi:MAG TPA: TilS substrate-binding domain-containing protein, partial [Pilimelia sp.]|nr:TilS substrate-binding domain-containing protein [Pilimelia sp.]
AADAAALDEVAGRALAGARDDLGGLGVDQLVGLPPAILSRVLHAWARELGAPGGALSHRHVQALTALVTGWRGQGPVHLPGGHPVARVDGRLCRVAAAEPRPHLRDRTP